MKKRRHYTSGAIFELCGKLYILTRIMMGHFGLISLGDNSNRWTKPMSSRATHHSISDQKLREMIGIDPCTDRVRKYSYLGQFPEVFKKVGS